MSKKEISIAEKFCVQRIQEFPTLYPHKYAILADTLFNGIGGAKWNDDGCIVTTDLHYNNETKKMEPYPFVISEEVAESMLLHYMGQFLPSHYSDFCSPIDNIPNNIEDSWEKEIYYFLCSYREYTPEVIEQIAKTKTFLHHGVWENKNASQPQRTITEYTRILKKIPSWIARLKEIRYMKENKKINPDSYIGMYI